MVPNAAPPELPDVEWIFGYGSLMWRPGFDHVAQCAARLQGYHRAPCVYSHYHRGSVGTPGLVLGLDSGGHCDGIAFKFNVNNRAQVIGYLNERELIGYAYQPITLSVDTEAFGPVDAYTFVADPDHENYAGAMSLDEAAAIIMRAEGISGLNRDYLINTVQKFLDEGFHEPDLLSLMSRVRQLTGELDQGGGI